MSCQRIIFTSLLCLGLCIAGATTLVANPKQIIDDPTHIEAGKIRFAQNCAYCHGAQGSGGKHKKLQCRDFKNDYLFDVITNGMARGSYFMPPWDHFSEEKRWELVAYLQSLGKLEQCNG